MLNPAALPMLKSFLDMSELYNGIVVKYCLPFHVAGVYRKLATAFAFT